LVLSLGFDPPAHAAPPASTPKCEYGSSSPASVIEACSEALQDSATKPPARAHLTLIRGSAEQALGKQSEAIADFSQVIELDIAQAQALATSPAGLGANFAQEQRGLGESAVLAAELATAHANRGLIRFMQGDNDSAIADLTSAARLAPDYAQIYLYRSAVYTQLGKATDAIADAEHALQLAPRDAMAWNARCWGRAVGNTDLPAALTDCDRALELARSAGARAEVLDSRALVRYRQGRFDLAAADEDAAIAAWPAATASRFLKGLAEERLGKTAEGRADIATAVAADPKLADQYARWGLRPDKP